MGVKSPSKYTSLKLLESIRDDNCIGRGGKEYCQYELNQLIYEKQTKQSEKNNEKLLSEVSKMQEKPKKLKVIKNVDQETLKQFKILSIQREENEADTFKFLLDYFLESEGILNTKKMPF